MSLENCLQWMSAVPNFPLKCLWCRTAGRVIQDRVGADDAIAGPAASSTGYATLFDIGGRNRDISYLRRSERSTEEGDAEETPPKLGLPAPIWPVCE